MTDLPKELTEQDVANVISSVAPVIYNQLEQSVKNSQVCMFVLGAVMGHFLLSYADSDEVAKIMLGDAERIALTMFEALKSQRERLQ